MDDPEDNSEAEWAGPGEDAAETDGAATDSAATAAETDSAATAAETDSAATAAGDRGGGGRRVGAAEARSLAIEHAEQLLSDPVEDVIEVQSGDGEWHVSLEALEREAVPDTQDILARYEFTVADDGTLSGYGLVERYRRGDLRGGL